MGTGRLVHRIKLAFYKSGCAVFSPVFLRATLLRSLTSRTKKCAEFPCAPLHHVKISERPLAPLFPKYSHTKMVDNFATASKRSSKILSERPPCSMPPTLKIQKNRSSPFYGSLQHLLMSIFSTCNSSSSCKKKKILKTSSSASSPVAFHRDPTSHVRLAHPVFVSFTLCPSPGPPRWRCLHSSCSPIY